MMNIIELARVKYASQESRRQEEQLFHQKMRNKLLEKQENKYFINKSERSNSYSILEISFSQEKERVQEEIKTATKNVLDDLNDEEQDESEKKDQLPVEKDMLYDSFENTEIQQIQKAQSTISEIKVHLKRANSMQQNAQIFQKEDTYDYINNIEPLKLEKSNSLKSNSIRRSTEQFAPGIKQKVIVYNRKMGYQHDKVEDDLIQMEKWYIKYIAQSCVEFETIKKGYSKWYSQKLNSLPSMTKEKRMNLVRKFIIPEVVLKATIDESEASYSQLDEW